MPGDVEVSADGAFALADQIGFVRLEAVDAEAVLLRVDGHGAQAQFSGGAKDADGDFAAIGDEQFFSCAQREAHIGGGVYNRGGAWFKG